MERLWFSLVVFVSLASVGCAYPRGTSKVEPVELYPGDNVVRITDPAGIRRVELGVPEKYLEYVELDGAGDVEGCPTEHIIAITLNTATINLAPAVIVYSCDSSKSVLRLPNLIWRVDVNRFADTSPGEKVCRRFEIALTGVGVAEHILDSVTSPDPRVSIDIVDSMPVRMDEGRTFEYGVCFTADREGEFRFPVITWMRREYPFGGLTNYPVADTGVIRVSRSEAEIGKSADK